MADGTLPGLRLIRILEVMAASDRPLTPTEINETLGWPKQSIHRLCNTLIEEGYLEKRDRKLHPRQRLFALSTNLSHLDSAHVARHQILLRIAETVGETVNFVRPETSGMFYSDRVETNWPFRIQLPIGTHVPFHCTASGKTWLASLKGAKRDKVLNSLHLKIFTDQTHRSLDTLKKELATIRRDGHSRDYEEFHDSMVAIAVPVLDSKGRFYAALAVHGPKPRFTIEIAKQHKELMVSASKEISKTLE